MVVIYLKSNGQDIAVFFHLILNIYFKWKEAICPFHLCSELWKLIKTYLIQNKILCDFMHAKISFKLAVLYSVGFDTVHILT